MARHIKRRSIDEAKEILTRHCLDADSKVPATNRTAHKSWNAEGKDLAWWTEDSATTPEASNSRTIAYLKAYLEMGEELFFATGIPLDRGYLYPDRAVMRALLQGGYVRMTDDAFHRFEVTDEGRLLVA